MSISWIIGIGMLMGSLVTSLGMLYLDSYDWRHSQVGIDNLAIEIGKEDSDILEMLRIKNMVLTAAEKIHHVLHACARIPWTAAGCVAPDEAAEASIRVLVRTTKIAATTRWLTNGTRTTLKLSEIGKGGVLRRMQTVPFDTSMCPICHLESGFRLTQSSIRHHLSTFEKQRYLQVGVKIVGKSLTQKERWNYKLNLGEEHQ